MKTNYITDNMPCNETVQIPGHVPGKTTDHMTGQMPDHIIQCSRWDPVGDNGIWPRITGLFLFKLKLCTNKL